MGTLREQIGNKCIHFNGIMNDTCNVGVKYADVRIGRPYKFPCLKQGGICGKCEFMTSEQVEQEILETSNMGNSSITALVKIKKQFQQTNERKGITKCNCGGTIHYSIAEINKHVWAKCTGCGLSIME